MFKRNFLAANVATLLGCSATYALTTLLSSYLQKHCFWNYLPIWIPWGSRGNIFLRYF